MLAVALACQLQIDQHVFALKQSLEAGAAEAADARATQLTLTQDRTEALITAHNKSNLQKLAEEKKSILQQKLDERQRKIEEVISLEKQRWLSAQEAQLEDLRATARTASQLAVQKADGANQHLIALKKRDDDIQKLNKQRTDLIRAQNKILQEKETERLADVQSLANRLTDSTNALAQSKNISTRLLSRLKALKEFTT